MNINELQQAWIAAGDKVADAQEEVNRLAIMVGNDPKSVTDEDLQKANDNLKKAKSARDFALSAYKSAQEDHQIVNEQARPAPVPVDDVNGHKQFANGIRDLLKGHVKRLNLVTTSATEGSNAGLTIPEDVQTRINEVIRQYDALQPLVNVETVSAMAGSRVIEPFTVMDGLVELDDEDGVIGDNDAPTLKTVKYSIKRYAGINKATNSLIKESDENIITWLVNWIAKKVVVTRNKKIIGVLNAPNKKPTLSTWDDVIKLSDGTLDPAINSLGVYLTNQSGWVALKMVKNAMGDYLIQRDPQGTVAPFINGHQVVVVSDNWLADPASGTHPLYFGDFRDGITLFDRESMSLAVTTEGGDSFVKDQTWIRVIDRFDVELIDGDAFAAGSFSVISNQTANFAASAATTAGK